MRADNKISQNKKRISIAEMRQIFSYIFLILKL